MMVLDVAGAIIACTALAFVAIPDPVRTEVKTETRNMA